MESILECHPGAQILLPTGVGDHVDHVCLSTAAQQVVDDAAYDRFGFYEDLPYNHGRDIPESLVAKYCLEHCATEIDMASKLTYIRSYASQPVELWIGAVEAHARDVSPSGGCAERLWFPRKKDDL